MLDSEDTQDSQSTDRAHNKTVMAAAVAVATGRSVVDH